MVTEANGRYLRYVDDVRIFASGSRELDALGARFSEAAARVGLVANSIKTRRIDTRMSSSWLREPDYHQFLESPRRGQTTAEAQRGAKSLFLAKAAARPGSPKDELGVRRALGMMLPDDDVARRLFRILPSRPDIWELAFAYLSRFSNSPLVSASAWRRLRRQPLRDWESARLADLAISSFLSQNLTPSRRVLLAGLANRKDLPMTQSQATVGLIVLGKRVPTAKLLAQLSPKAVHLAAWLPVWLKPAVLKRSKRSVRATAKMLLRRADDKAGLLLGYLLGAKLSSSLLGQLPSLPPGAGRIVMSTAIGLGHASAGDEISPLLKAIFGLTPVLSFDFSTELRSVDPRWYRLALRHLQLAAWYVETSPTYFVNHIHNFNPVLWHHALRKHGIMPSTTKWTNTMTFLTASAAKTKFPKMASAFDQCRVMRNTNLSSHPMDDKLGRGTRLVTYEQRNRIRHQLRAAYSEFVAAI